MKGTLILQGGSPFVGNDDIDREFFAKVTGTIAVLPTADAFEQPQALIDASITWAQRIGVRVSALNVYTRRDALDITHEKALRAADAVVLVGDSPMHLRSTLKDTPVWSAIVDAAQNKIVMAVGPSAGALCDPMVDPRGGTFTLGLGLVQGLALITEAETWSHDRLTRSLKLANCPVAVLPTNSALIRRNNVWERRGEITLHGDLPSN